MMITKVKYSYNKWMENTVNNTASSLGVDIIEAGGADQYSSATDLFPNGATEYTPYTNYPIINISARSGLISFDFMNTPNGLEQTQATPTQVRKILKDGRLLILQGEQWYDITGQKVRYTTKAVRPLVKSSDAQLKNTIKECTRREGCIRFI